MVLFGRPQDRVRRNVSGPTRTPSSHGNGCDELSPKSNGRTSRGCTVRRMAPKSWNSSATRAEQTVEFCDRRSFPDTYRGKKAPKRRW